MPQPAGRVGFHPLSAAIAVAMAMASFAIVATAPSSTSFEWQTRGEVGNAHTARTAAGRGSAYGAARQAAPILGVNADFLAYDPALRNVLAERLADASISVVRVPIRWSELEPRPGEIEWEVVDEALLPLTRRDIRVLAVVTTSPAWAHREHPPPDHLWLCSEVEPSLSEITSALAPPSDENDFAGFVVQLAERFGPDLWAIEVWSEPNLMPNWRVTGPAPEEYARLLEAVAAKLGSAGLATPVMSASLAPTTDIGVCYMSDRVFLERLARSGALGTIDYVGVEAWGLRQGVAPVPEEDALVFRRPELLHRVLIENGLADKPIVVGAWGWNAGPSPGPWGRHPVDDVARYLTEGYALASRDWPWAEAMFTWHLLPDARVTDPVWGFSLSSPEGAPGALWQPLIGVMSEPGGQAPEVQPLRKPPRTTPLAVLAVIAAVLLTTLAVSALPRLGRSGLARMAAALSRVGAAGSFPRWAGAATTALALCALSLYVQGSPAVAIGLGGAGLLALLSAGRPEGMAVMAVLAAPFSHALPIGVAGRPLDPFQLLAVLSAFGTALRFVALLDVERNAQPSPAGRLWSKVHWLDAVVMALVVWGALTPLWARFPEPAIREWRAALLAPSLVYFALRSAPVQVKAAASALAAVVAGATLAAIWALIEYGAAAIGLRAGVRAEGVLRASGPFGSPNNLALYVGRGLAAIAGYVASGNSDDGRSAGGDDAPRRFTSRRWRGIDGGRHVAAGLLGVLGVLVLTGALSFSRGLLFIGLPAVAATAMGLAVRRRVRLRPIVLALGLVALAVVVFVLAFSGTERIAGVVDPSPGGTVFIRLRLWRASLEMIRDEPLLGFGLDNFLYAYRDIYVPREVAQERFLSHPHNLFLDAWLRLGLPGLLLILTLLAGGLREGWRGLRGREPRLAGAGLALMLYGVAHGFVDNALFLPELATAWLVAIVAVVAARQA